MISKITDYYINDGDFQTYREFINFVHRSKSYDKDIEDYVYGLWVSIRDGSCTFYRSEVNGTAGEIKELSHSEVYGKLKGVALSITSKRSNFDYRVGREFLYNTNIVHKTIWNKLVDDRHFVESVIGLDISTEGGRIQLRTEISRWSKYFIYGGVEDIDNALSSAESIKDIMRLEYLL